jgi:hypothetical protein
MASVRSKKTADEAAEALLRIAPSVGPYTAKEILGEIARAMTDRRWFPSPDVTRAIVRVLVNRARASWDATGDPEFSY